MGITAGAARAEPLTTGKWLVDLGRDYPLSPQAALTDADAELTLLFMEAGARVEPDLAEAYLWQYDLLSAMGRRAAATEALANYVKRQPDDLTARLHWVALMLEELQTAEQRAAFCRKRLEQADLPPELNSDLQRRLATYHFNRGEFDDARLCIDAALRAYPPNMAARELLAEMGDVLDAPVWRVDTLLGMLAVCPAQADAAWQLGNELAALQMPRDAARWYAHAAELASAGAEDDALVSLQTAHAQVLIDIGQLDDAANLLDELKQTAPDVIDVHTTLARLETKRGNEQAASDHIAVASQLWRRLLRESGGQLDGDIVAGMAWFFTHYDTHAEEAEKLARSALATRSDSVVARRAIGSALRRLDRLEEARIELSRTADVDHWSAIELAQTLYAQGKASDAAERLRALVRQGRLDGEQNDVVAELMKQWELSPTTQPVRHEEIRARLSAFPSAVLDFPFQPERYLSFKVIGPNDAVPPGEPWPCTFVLENVGPFSIPLGADMMVAPNVLCRVEAGNKYRSFLKTDVQLSLDRRLRLKPGEKIEITQTVDIGSVRATMIGTPQVNYRITVSAMLNPMADVDERGNVSWGLGVGGVTAKTVTFNRSAFVPDAASMKALFARSRSSNVNERWAATEMLAMLLAEHQHLQARRLKYDARPIDTTAVQQALLARGQDDDWRVRARLAEAMRWFVLDKTANNAAARLLSDPHWLVRGLAMRMLADHHAGKIETKVLRPFAERDADPWVRRMGRTLLQRLQTRRRPTTAPGR